MSAATGITGRVGAAVAGGAERNRSAIFAGRHLCWRALGRVAGTRHRDRDYC
jgi:hypothetical protein